MWRSVHKRSPKWPGKLLKPHNKDDIAKPGAP